MDKLPSGVARGADGAFERFLTAALATIITIMFSWRLLAEEEEAAGRGEGPRRPYRTPQPFPPNPKPSRSGNYGNNSPDSGNSSANVSNISDIDVSDSEETDTSRSRSTNIDREFQVPVRESVISEYYRPVNDHLLEAIPSHSADDNLSFSSQADDTATDETLTTWDEYKWEEELGQEKRDVIKTRRSVRDFVKSANNSGSLESSPTASTSNTGSHNNENTLSPSQDSPSSSSSNTSSPCVPFTQRFANFEYKDMGGDSGYIDLYPDVESDESDSSDDENVYDLQVSDSDSSSEDERADRGTAFYGLTSLDTIMEEYESDTDICDRGQQRGDNSRGTGNKHDNSGCIEHCDGSELNRRDEKMDTVQVLEILEPKIENVENSNVQMSQNDSLSNANSSFQNETFIKSSQAENVECNVSPDIILKADDKIISPKLDGHPRVSKPIKVCDLSVNNTASLNSGMLHKQENEKYQVNLNNVSVSHNAAIPVASGQNDQRQINFQNNEHHENVPKLKLTENEFTVSEISDDSLPPSPISRTCALDNPTDELFSDTESCCESVITVLSVRSNDSETTPHDRYDVTSPFNALIIPTTCNEDASGQTDHPLIINDKQVDTLSPYEQNSLVSGFLNDSLNSLLSANTGSNDTGSENDLDQHATIDINTGTEQCMNSQNTQNIIQSQISCIQMNGTNTSDNSSAESLPLILADAQHINPISPETGNQNVNGLIEINSESSQNCHSRLFEQIDIDEIRINNQQESDNWSDTSDPPLREYDPDEDDLAAFQFNIDSDDEDSLYLIVGDEGLRNFGGDDGGLRNFETFTNLNSIGLSPEYSDAVPSHTVADDGHGFTFSVTEQENTEFRKRTYVTDRNNMSDSDTRSDGLLSPVLSDNDDESKKHENENIENQDKTEQTSSESMDQTFKQNVERKNAYQDADLSLLVQDTETNDCKKTRETESRSIDFKKYIIQTDKTPVFVLDTAVNEGDLSTESGHKDVLIAPVSDSACYSTVSTGVDSIPGHSDTLGVNSVNNETRDNDQSDGQSETLASLTEKIRSLSVDDDTTLHCASSDQDSIKNTNSVTVQDVDSESDKELKRAPVVNDSVDAGIENKDLSLSNETKQHTQSKETNIDDFVTTESLNRSLEQRVPLRETNIDDIFNENAKFLKANLKKKTNIDESLDKQTETNDQGVTNVKSVKDNFPRKLKIETNIDDIFNDDTTNSNESLVGKPPPHLETNVDELLSESVTTDDKKIISKNKYVVALETCVDDISVDVDNTEQTDGHPSLSYETFVDDLFDNIVPSTTSHTQSVQQFITSESAADHDKSAIQTSVIPDYVPQHSNQSTNLNHELPLKPTTNQQISINSPQIEHNRDVNTSDEPEYYNSVNRDTSARDTSIPKDYGSDKQPIKSTTNVTYLETLPNIPRDPPLSQKYEKFDTQQNISDLKDKSRDFKDRTKTPDTNDQNNSKCIDNKSDNINNLQSIKNDVDKEYKNTNNETESIGIIKSLENKTSEQPTSSLSENDNSGNENQLKLRDHNGNVAVPKDGILNVSPKTKFLGLHPELNNSNNYTSIDNSLEAELASGKSRGNDTPNTPENYEISNEDIELKIVEDLECLDSYSSIGSCSLTSDGEESLSSLEDSYNSLQESYTGHRLRGLSDSAAGRVVRSPATKPSDFFGKSKNTPAQGVKKRIRKHNLKKYSSILQQPITPERVHCANTAPEQSVSLPRLKVLQSRQKFLSAENLATGNNFEDKFLQHRTSLVTSTPRKYLKRHERNLPENQSTESLPTEMSNLSLLNSSYDGYSSMDRMHSLPSPRHINDIYASRFSSANSSYEKPDHQSLHANCMFSPHKREEIRHTTKSLENMFEQLLRYGSVSSLAETDLDATDVIDDVTSHGQLFHDSDYNDIISFQYPLERAASMSALYGSSDGHRLPREPRKGRFASRLVPKSKSLQTLETNLDDVFADENELSVGGELKKTPSVHELRVSKSLSKLAVPDWFKKSSFSRSGSTQSLFTYAGRQGSTSTLGSCAYPPSITSSPSTSVTPCSNTVIIQKRVTPSLTTPSSARLIRAPMLPMTPEKAPIHNTSSVGLPSDKYRQKDSKKDLKPIAIIPFSKLREMFERKSSQSTSKSKSPIQSPTKETAPKVRFEAVTPTREYNPLLSSPSKETVIDEPVQIQRTISPKPDIPERRPILTDNVRKSESVAQNSQPRKTQVHFSDEPNVSKPQEQNTNAVRQNGTAPSTSKSSNVKKPSSLRTSLPLPQFRFRRPGVFATKASTPAAQNTSTQSKKGKPNGNNGYTHAHNGTGNYSEHFLKSSLVHALEHKAKTDGETLFEFLQKRRYSSLLENGFAEQLDELQDRDVTFNFPVLSLGKHSSNNGGIAPIDGAPDLQVILTNAYADNVQNDYVNNKLRGDASLDEVLDGLLIMDGQRTGRMRIGENGRIVPKMSEKCIGSPDTPPGLVLNTNSNMCNGGGVYKDDNDNFYTENEAGAEYAIVKCQYDECKRETNLREAKTLFKTCHSCYTYYCGRSCRKHHWEAHKKVCIYSRLNSACKHVVKYINRQPHLQYQCSRIARRGYLAQGRGCVVFAFPDISSAEDFLSFGMESLWVPPMYVGLKELPNASMLGSKLELLTKTCRQYNPELKYVIHVAIVIPPKLPVQPIPRKMETIIQKCAKLRLSPAHMHPKQDTSRDDNPSTLILTAVPGNQHVDEVDSRKTRELCFVNIQRKLRHRNVSLRHQFSDVYNKLIDFVSDAKHFSPLIIYPIDGRTNKRFMCVIMPEAEPEIEWIRDPDLFHELDVFDNEDDADVTTPNLSLNLQELPEYLI